MHSPSKRSTHVDMEPLIWTGRRPGRLTRWKIKPWQDIVALLGFAVAVGVFVFLFLWGLSAGAF